DAPFAWADADLFAVLAEEHLREDRVEDPPRLVAAGDPAFHDHELVVAPEAGMAEELAVAAETPARASPRTAEDHDVGAPRVDVLAVAELVGEMAVSHVRRRMPGEPAIVEPQHVDRREPGPVGQAAGGVDGDQRLHLLEGRAQHQTDGLACPVPLFLPRSFVLRVDDLREDQQPEAGEGRADGNEGPAPIARRGPGEPLRRQEGEEDGDGHDVPATGEDLAADEAEIGGPRQERQAQEKEAAPTLRIADGGEGEDSEEAETGEVEEAASRVREAADEPCGGEGHLHPRRVGDVVAVIDEAEAELPQVGGGRKQTEAKRERERFPREAPAERDRGRRRGGVDGAVRARQGRARRAGWRRARRAGARRAGREAGRARAPRREGPPRRAAPGRRPARRPGAPKAPSPRRRPPPEGPRGGKAAFRSGTRGAGSRRGRGWPRPCPESPAAARRGSSPSRGGGGGRRRGPRGGWNRLRRARHRSRSNLSLHQALRVAEGDL